MPFSRAQESEADRIGLILMAKAGYDPHAALALWLRFEQLPKQAHRRIPLDPPGYGTREHNIEAWMPEAMGYFHPT